MTPPVLLIEFVKVVDMGTVDGGDGEMSDGVDTASTGGDKIGTTAEQVVSTVAIVVTVKRRSVKAYSWLDLLEHKMCA